MKKMIFAIAILLSVSTKAETPKKDFTSRCRVQNDEENFPMSRIVFYGPFSYVGPQVETYVVYDETSESVKVDAKIVMNTWITFRADFIYQGEEVYAIYSNYLTPSFGHLHFPDGRVKLLACELNRGF